jgi:predicted lipoprotein with Yx(FWY)xxD motif
MRRGLLISITLALVTAGTALAALPRAHVSVRSTSLGSVLVDTRGHTLYAFDLDKGTKSSAPPACAHWAALSKTGAKLKPQAGGTGTTPAPTPTTTDPYGGGGDGYGY